jgi:hypothetical protein
MDDASRAGDGRAEVALSAAEEAYLRRLVRRHAFSGTAGRALLGGVFLALALAFWPAWVAQHGAPAAAPGVEALDAELDALRIELAARGSPAGVDPGTRAAVAELAERIEAIAREISALRRRFETTPAPPPADAPPAVPADVAAIAERLYDVEMRQSQAEASRAEIEGKLLARLHGLESRQEHREREDASVLRSMLDRVDRLEASRDVAEARRLESQNAVLARLGALESRLESVPASPQP